MIQLLKIFVIVVVSLANGSMGFADSASPIGLWKTIDDETGEVKSLVRISEEDGSLVGTIAKLFPKPGKDPNPVCDKCPGEKKDQPLVGMVILWGLTKQGEEWTGGFILDPNKGKIYKCKIKLEGAGGTLTVRGYIGFSLLGRSQTWIRMEPNGDQVEGCWNITPDGPLSAPSTSRPFCRSRSYPLIRGDSYFVGIADPSNSV